MDSFMFVGMNFCELNKYKSFRDMQKHSKQYFIRNFTSVNNEFHGSTSSQIHKNSVK